jgi:cytoskeletal protein CcmA (bactofilin family)
MFTKKPEREPIGSPLTKMSERPSGPSTSPFAERPATSYVKTPTTTSGKSVPSIIGEDLMIVGNVTSNGEIQVDGEIQGDVHCGSLLLGETSKITGSVIAEDIVVRGRQAQSHVEGDIYHQSLAIEQGAYFEGKSRRSDDPFSGTAAAGSGKPASAAAPAAAAPERGFRSEVKTDKPSSFEQNAEGDAKAASDPSKASTAAE